MQRYNGEAAARRRTFRALDSLKLKVYRLVSVRKPTGDLGCPSEARHVKNLSNHMKDRAVDGNVGSSSESGNYSVIVMDREDVLPDAASTIQVPRNQDNEVQSSPNGRKVSQSGNIELNKSPTSSRINNYRDASGVRDRITHAHVGARKRRKTKVGDCVEKMATSMEKLVHCIVGEGESKKDCIENIREELAAK